MHNPTHRAVLHPIPAKCVRPWLRLGRGQRYHTRGEAPPTGALHLPVNHRCISEYHNSFMELHLRQAKHISDEISWRQYAGKGVAMQSCTLSSQALKTVKPPPLLPGYVEPNSVHAHMHTRGSLGRPRQSVYPGMQQAQRQACMPEKTLQPKAAAPICLMRPEPMATWEDSAHLAGSESDGKPRMRGLLKYLACPTAHNCQPHLHFHTQDGYRCLHRRWWGLKWGPPGLSKSFYI